MDRLEALIGLNKVCDIGSIRLNKLLNFFGQPQKIFEASEEKLMAVSGIGQKITQQIRCLKKEDIDQELKLASRYNLKIITIGDEDYPKNLTFIPDPPIVLYVKGELKAQDRLSVAVVGSRHASFYGLTKALEFALDLSLQGFTIVSGMARGVDTAAHKGALKNKGRTIAVIGSGFRHIYPAENKEVAQEIAKNGAVISEFPIDTEPLKQNFPRRNRVISGLSLGVLVVEAAQNSGALITADFALEQGREVFALPGEVDSKTSFGTNELIKQGAKLVSDVEDILEEFNLVDTKKLFSDADLRRSNADTRRFYYQDNLRSSALKENLKPDLSYDESLLYNLISDQPLAFDEIAEKINMGIAGISDIILRLEMKKLIRQLPGKQFERVQNEK
jgi:DNA processing protein